MGDVLNLLAFDCGNSSIRTILCRFDGTSIESEIILQEPNGIHERGGYLYWDTAAIFGILKRGLGMAHEKAGRIDSVGICTWGVDFQMLDREGGFTDEILCYRNPIGESEISLLSAEQQKEMFYRTGILCDRINSVFMLKGIGKCLPHITERAEKMLLVPDIFVWLFTGKVINEPCELSTTQMMDVRTMTICEDICEYAGVKADIFGEIGKHGKLIGNIKREILDELGIGYDIPFLCVPSHDTACAALAIPSMEDEYLFVSSGTWALVGAQCASPIVDDRVYEAHLTNEVGGFGYTTLLRNNAGMFIIQRLKEEYQRETGEKISWNDFTALADPCRDSARHFDVNDARLFNPECMADEIMDLAGIGKAEDKARRPWPLILASTYISLGDSFAEVLTTVMSCTGKSYDRIYIVGGGSRNRMINERCAEKTGLPVSACDMECSSVGNAVSQIAYFHPEYTYGQLRKIVCSSLTTKIYSP